MVVEYIHVVAMVLCINTCCCYGNIYIYIPVVAVIPVAVDPLTVADHIEYSSG